MTRRLTTLAWSAAASTYLLIVLGAVVRITGSGLGCGDHWPLCKGRLFPPLDDVGTVIEWSHRLVAALVSVLVVGLATFDWWLRPSARPPVRPSYVAVALLLVQVLLGAITVKLELPPWSVVLHLGTAMLLLATLLITATSPPDPLSALRRGGTLTLLSLAFVTVLFGALTANLGAAAACGGFPLCNGQVWVTAGPLALIHWTHRLLAYSLAIAAAAWAVRTPGRAPKAVLALIALQVAIGAATVLLGLPRGLQAAHVAVGTAVWAGVVLAAVGTKKAPEGSSPGPLPPVLRIRAGRPSP
jgi:heme A synthase